MDAAVEQQQHPERRWREGKFGGRLLVGPSIRGPKPAVTVANELDKALRKLGGWKYFYKAATSKHLAERVAALRVIGQRDRDSPFVAESLTVVVQRLVREPYTPLHGVCSPLRDMPVAPIPASIEGETVVEPEAKE